jgi:hypothetical protein
MVWKKGKILIKQVVKYFGDDVQLPPVLDSPVYNTSGKTAAALHGALVWKNFNHAVNLQQVVRQVPDQQQLKEVLCRAEYLNRSFGCENSPDNLNKTFYKVRFPRTSSSRDYHS